jgi:hypothetical protein
MLFTGKPSSSFGRNQLIFGAEFVDVGVALSVCVCVVEPHSCQWITSLMTC